jgi:hypothetical protein
VLNADNVFDERTLIIHQMRRVIEVFTTAPYDCHVFNLSLGDNTAWLRRNPRQSLWAESLDIIAREFNVLLVVSAGNQNLGWSNIAGEAEEILASYPDYLFDPDCGLCEPATAAIPLTVGGIADRDIPALPIQPRIHDITRTIATIGEPTPTTRIGPGINNAIKPEFVAPAGYLAFQGFGIIRRVDDDPELAIMSLSHEPTRRLFAYDTGTSFAALSSTIGRDSLEQPGAILGRRTSGKSCPGNSCVGRRTPQPDPNRIKQEHGDEDSAESTATAVSTTTY